MIGARRGDLIRLRIDHQPGTHLVHLKRVREPTEHAVRNLEYLFEPRWTIELEGLLSAQETECLEEPGQAEEMVAV
jgi:hypothetical protein